MWFVVHEYERDESRRDYGTEAAEALGVDHDRVFKTLLVSVVGATDGVTEAVAIVPVSAQVALKSFAAATGAKRAEMCERSRAERLTGYVVGGISPFGQKKRLPTVIDETCELAETIYVSGGKRGVDVEVRPGDLVGLLDAVVADIAAFGPA